MTREFFKPFKISFFKINMGKFYWTTLSTYFHFLNDLLFKRNRPHSLIATILFAISCVIDLELFSRYFLSLSLSLL